MVIRKRNYGRRRVSEKSWRVLGRNVVAGVQAKKLGIVAGGETASVKQQVQNKEMYGFSSNIDHERV